MKARMFLLGLIFAGITTVQAQQLREIVTPDPGVDTIAAVGETVYEKSRQSVVSAYEITEGFSGKNVFAFVSMPAGTKFIAIQSKSRLKACTSPSLELFRQAIYSACVYDDDGDGTFDRFGANEVQGGKKLARPVPYRRSEYVQPTADSIKQVVIYLGSTKDTLRLSYREFVNDMARPAFTEEYTFPLSDKFPQVVAFKGAKITVSAIDGEGIHYRLKP